MGFLFLHLKGGDLMTEGRIITKKELMENRLKVLKRNSTLFHVSDFIKK